MNEQKLDEGHERLIDELVLLLSDARSFRYHDFKTKEATPKALLVYRLREIEDLAKQGAFDNRP